MMTSLQQQKLLEPSIHFLTFTDRKTIVQNKSLFPASSPKWVIHTYLPLHLNFLYQLYLQFLKVTNG
jgi:hypothetical protein